MAVTTAQHEIRDFVAAAVKSAEACAKTAWAIKAITGSIYTPQPTFYWYHPEKQAVAVSVAEGRPYRPVVSALKQAFGDIKADTEPQLMQSGYIKVAYSPTLRRAGELLNFFPGHYPMGIRNSPSPLMAMLTSGLVGAGLGYGGGRLARKALGWEDPRLENNAALLGGLVGASPGALWALTNALSGKPVNSHRPFMQDPHTRPYGASNVRSREIPKWDKKRDPFGDAKRPPSRVSFAPPEVAADLAKASAYIDVELSPRYVSAVEKLAWLPGTGLDGGGPPLLNTDVLGHTLWNVPGLPGQVTQTTLAAMETAKQFPGGPGPDSSYVTFDQIGNMAMGMGVGYGQGALVGKALGLLIGMPEPTQNLLARTGMYAGLVKSVVPKLFGG